MGAPGVCVFVVGREVRVFGRTSRLRRDVVCRRRSIFEKRGKAEEQKRRRLKRERGATPFWSLFPASLYSRAARCASYRPRESRNAAGGRGKEPARNRNEREASNFSARHRHHQRRRRCCSLPLFSLARHLSLSLRALTTTTATHLHGELLEEEGTKEKEKRKRKRKREVEVRVRETFFRFATRLFFDVFRSPPPFTLSSLFFPLTPLIKWEPRRRAAPS